MTRTDPATPGAPSTLGVIAGIAAALAVAAGAFGAHGLRSRLSAADLAIFDTAARYHLVHALGALLAADRAGRTGGRLAVASGVVLLLGVGLFSGSLYALALGTPRIVGAITPFGGVAFIAGWLLLGFSFRR